MGKFKWKESESNLSKSRIDISDVAVTDPIIREDMTFNEMSKKSPTDFIYRVERWCPFCGNAESYVKNIKKISKLKDLAYVQLVLRTIDERKMKEFMVHDLLRELNAEEISDGTLQRKALVVLSCLGYIKKVGVEFTEETGKKKIKVVHNRNIEVAVPQCYNSSEDNHLLDWDAQATESRYFWKGREEIESDED